MLQRFDQDTPPDQLQAQLTITRQLIKPQEDLPIGIIDTEAWIQTETIMIAQQQIERPLEVQTALMPAFAF